MSNWSSAPPRGELAQPVFEPDWHSFANPADVRVRHLRLTLDIDFDAHVLEGSAALDLVRRQSASRVVLDTRDLQIARVSDARGQELRFELGPPDPLRGQALAIDLDSDTTRIVVEYATSPDAAALQWLTPEQTAGGRSPFLFSQGHAILTRSWIPTQDSPAVRQSFEARITVGADLSAVMSAERLPRPGATDAQAGVLEFRMAAPIPPSLIALAAGEIASAPIGPRTTVWAEPVMLEHARQEFADLESMVAAAETIAGPYRWNRFDVLVMPPSFPFGGMENPCMVFVSPTAIAGDRSLVTLLAHELVHAWAGNLVSNAHWRDFWLNEGMAVYLELRVIEALYGKARAVMLEAYGRQQLAAELARVGLDSPDTRLAIGLEGRDPLEAVTVVPYVKGAALLQTLEQHAGREHFDRFLRGWFERHAFATVTADTFMGEVREHLPEVVARLQRSDDLDTWVYGTGLPPNACWRDSDAFAKVERQVQALLHGVPAAELPTEQWTPQEWRHFLGELNERASKQHLWDLDATYALSKSQNAEILAPWLRLAVQTGYEPAVPALEQFLAGQGRRKFLLPLYRELMQHKAGRELAQRVYALARPRYHATTRATLDPVMGWSQDDQSQPVQSPSDKSAYLKSELDSKQR